MKNKIDGVRVLKPHDKRCFIIQRERHSDPGWFPRSRFVWADKMGREERGHYLWFRFDCTNGCHAELMVRDDVFSAYLNQLMQRALGEEGK